jgi:hypothetical protein
MSTIIDGRTHQSAKVDSNGRVHTAAIVEPEKDHAAEFGQKFNINTGDITLTDANKTSLLYMKNTGEDDIILSAIIYNMGATASGTGDVLWEVLRNPTTGDIITNANNVAIGPGANANQNFGSANLISALIYKGATSEGVLSDGAVTISTRSASNTGRIFLDLGAVVIPKNTSIAVEYTPPASNTSQIVQVAFACYVKTIKVSDVL